MITVKVLVSQCGNLGSRYLRDMGYGPFRQQCEHPQGLSTVINTEVTAEGYKN